MSNVERVLTKAKEKINKGWCKDAGAVDINGKYISPRSKEAVAWCAIGAISAVTESEVLKVEAFGLLSFCTNKGFPDIVDYNDAPRRTKKQILALYDRAIKRSKDGDRTTRR